jgi:hypothetical protein
MQLNSTQKRKRPKLLHSGLSRPAEAGQVFNVLLAGVSARGGPMSSGFSWKSLAIGSSSEPATTSAT